MAGNYLLSYTNTNCGNAPEARDGYFTTYYSFNKIVLDVITEKFDIQIDKNTRKVIAPLLCVLSIIMQINVFSFEYSAGMALKTLNLCKIVLQQYFFKTFCWTEVNFVTEVHSVLDFG